MKSADFLQADTDLGKLKVTVIINGWDGQNWASS